MGYRLSEEDFGKAMRELMQTHRIFAPVRKAGEGRFTDTDVIRYDFVRDPKEMELEEQSDYAFAEMTILHPGSGRCSGRSR